MSSSILTPLAPTGCPHPIRPPLGFIGFLPLKEIVPSSIALYSSPGLVMPKHEIATYSLDVKQSCVSNSDISVSYTHLTLPTT